MEQLKNFLAIIIFVGAYVLADIYVATAALMIVVAVQVGLLWLTKKPISVELKAIFWASMVLGWLTLFFRNEQFIQWKTTIVNTAVAALLIGTHIRAKTPERAYGTEVVLKKLLGSSELQLTDQPGAWRVINLGWIASFLFAAGLNLVVVYNFSLDAWVTYKLVGGMLITFTSVALTLFYMFKRGMISEPADAAEPGYEDTTLDLENTPDPS